MVHTGLLQIADHLGPVAEGEEVGRGAEVEVELTADGIVERVGETGGELAGRRLTELLQQGGVLIDVAGIGGDDRAEGRPRRVDVDLEDRVGGLVLHAFVVRVAGAPVEVLGGRVICRGAPDSTACVALCLRGRRNRRSDADDLAGLGVVQR